MKRIHLLFYLAFICILNNGHAQAPDFVTVFSNNFGGSQKEDFFAGAPCADGGYLMTGFTNSEDDDIDPLIAYDTTNIFVVKCNASGVKEWARTYGGNAYDKARYVMEDLDGNILVVGGTYSNDGDIDSTHGNSDFFILKLDPVGDIIWMKLYGGTGYEGGRFIKQFPSGDYLVAGYTTSQNYDIPFTRGLHDGLLMKLDVNGTLLWANTYGGSSEDRMRSYEETPDGGFLFFGSSESNDGEVSGNNGGADYWVGKVDSLGNHQWSKLFGGSADEFAYHIVATTDGNYLLTGCTYSNDGDVTGFKGGSDGWLVKIDPLGNLIWQQCYGGSLFDRLNRSLENSNGTITTFGFSQSSDFDLAGDNTGPSQNFWLAELDSSLNINWNYCTGGTNTDLGEDILFNPSDSSFILMGDSKSLNGAMLNNYGDYDFSILKIAQFTSIESVYQIHDKIWFDYISKKIIINSTHQKNVNLLIYDNIGKLIFSLAGIALSEGQNEISITGLSTFKEGLYTVAVLDDKKTAISRFVHIR